MNDKNKYSIFSAFLLTACLVTADVALAGPGTDAGSKTLYRYRNDRGVTVIDDNVPADMVKNGYEVISINGTVLERVDPALTDEQIEAKKVELERAAEVKRIQEWEESLLRRYRSVAEIEASRDRIIREFNNQVEILRGNLTSQRSQIEVQQQRAADLERRGRPVYESIRTNITALQGEMKSTEATIALRESEIDKARAEFDADIAQFKKILERRKKK
ncbi:MAG TPA: hypothetical protein VIM96_03580 [Pseudomonadales bacterium]